jgi:hypothetical protein
VRRRDRERDFLKLVLGVSNSNEIRQRPPDCAKQRISHPIGEQRNWEANLLPDVMDVTSLLAGGDTNIRKTVPSGRLVRNEAGIRIVESRAADKRVLSSDGE